LIIDANKQHSSVQFNDQTQFLDNIINVHSM